MPSQRTSTYKSISITLDDAKYYNRIIDKWAKKHEGVELTLPKMINLAMQKLEESL